MQILIGLALATLISEDLTSISAGLLARNGDITLGAAVAACAIGVYVGDLALWLAGRVLGPRLLDLPWIARRVDASALAALSARIDRNLAAAVIASRFLPGTRLPMYVAAGVWGRRPLAFAGWSLLAVLLWTPLLVVLTAAYGSSVTAPLLGHLGEISQFVITAALLMGALRLAMLAFARVAF
jgi:membrane protein DedA with SNARE-associated domain